MSNTVLAVGTGGGNVSNSAPTVDTFTKAGGATQTRNTAEVFAGTVHDKNGEARLSQISIDFTTAPVGVSPTRFDRAVDDTDRGAGSEPGFVGGWKVWNPVAGDGLLSFKFQYTWTVNGAYVVRALVQDQVATDRNGPAADISITINDGFAVAAEPVLAAGGDDTGASWGDWSAVPGALDTDGTNWLKITNTGTVATQPFTIDFTPSVFTGADLTTTFALNNNIKFACDETATGEFPNDPDLVFDLAGASASASGSVSTAFTGLSNIIYCQYRIVAIPNPLLDQDYTAAFTVT